MLEKSEFTPDPFEYWAENEAKFPEVTYASILKRDIVLPLQYFNDPDKQNITIFDPSDFPDGLTDYVTGIAVYVTKITEKIEGTAVVASAKMHVTINKLVNGVDQVCTCQISLREGDRFPLSVFDLRSRFDMHPLFRVKSIGKKGVLLEPIEASTTYPEEASSGDTRDAFDLWGDGQDELLGGLELMTILDRTIKLPITKVGNTYKVLHQISLEDFPEPLRTSIAHMFFYEIEIEMQKKSIGGIEIDEQEPVANVYFELLQNPHTEGTNFRFVMSGKVGDAVQLSSYTDMQNLPMSHLYIFKILEIGPDYVVIGPAATKI